MLNPLRISLPWPRAALLLVLFAGVALPAAAQEQPVLRYAQLGRPVVKILVLGAVGMPGVWEVEPNTDLLEFLTYARVQGVGTEVPEVRQRTRVRVYRGGQTSRNLIYEDELLNMIEGGVAYPSLQEGDVLTVEDIRRRRFNFASVSSYIGTASSLLLLYLRLRTLNE